MALLRIGSSGLLVKSLQDKLKKVLKKELIIDGYFGAYTEKAVKLFQRLHHLTVDGIVGDVTRKKLTEVYYYTIRPHFGKKRFVVFVDAGHGGIDDLGNYVTPGKRAFHDGEKLHEKGYYYEGYENRIIAEAFIEKCTEAGIVCIRTYHAYKDTTLFERSEFIRSWLSRGYFGYLHSFHSNAIALNNNADKLNDTKGFMVFSTKGDNFSDSIASKHFDHVKQIIGDKNWRYRTQVENDKDVDFEANFHILNETDLKEFLYFGAILEEWGFHTSREDALFITNEENRKKRVAAALQTAKWVKNNILK